MIYKVYTGVDYLYQQYKKENEEKCIATTYKLNDAIKYYDECIAKCKEMVKDEQYQYARLYCYILEVNNKKRLFGYKDGKRIDNGADCRTLYQENIAAHPEIHFMFKIGNGKRTPKWLNEEVESNDTQLAK